jgi:hypothetical protein
MWESCHARLALLELLTQGKLRRRQMQAESYDALAELPWTRATGRRQELALVEQRRADLVQLIARVWPEWPTVLAHLVAAGLPPTPQGYGRLLDGERAAALPPRLPDRLNRRTAAALAAPHSKAGLTETRRAALAKTAPTHDGSIRLRPPAGLTVRTDKGRVDLSAIAEVLGEVSIPERAFLDELFFEGTIRAVLLVENLGAWRDLPALPGWLLAHVPGWDTCSVAHLLDRITAIPVIHFGDIDPNGVRILLHLRRRVPEVQWFLPEFWFELAPANGLRASWPPDLDLDFAPGVVHHLARCGLWLEQERIVLDPRLVPALEAMIPPTLG